MQKEGKDLLLWKLWYHSFFLFGWLSTFFVLCCEQKKQTGYFCPFWKQQNAKKTRKFGFVIISFFFVIILTFFWFQIPDFVWKIFEIPRFTLFFLYSRAQNQFIFRNRAQTAGPCLFFFFKEEEKRLLGQIILVQRRQQTMNAEIVQFHGSHIALRILVENSFITCVHMKEGQFLYIPINQQHVTDLANLFNKLIFSVFLGPFFFSLNFFACSFPFQFEFHQILFLLREKHSQQKLPAL